MQISNDDKFIPVSDYQAHAEALFNRYRAIQQKIGAQPGSTMWNKIDLFAGLVQNPCVGITPDLSAELNENRLSIELSLVAITESDELIKEWRALVNDTARLFRPFGSLADEDRQGIVDLFEGRRLDVELDLMRVGSTASEVSSNSSPLRPEA